MSIMHILYLTEGWCLVVTVYCSESDGFRVVKGDTNISLVKPFALKESRLILYIILN